MTTKPANILSYHIGEQDIAEWLKEDGKRHLMPELLAGCERLLWVEDDELKVFRVEASIRGQSKAFDFFVRRKEMNDTLDKIMEWAIDEEEYEMCERVKNVKEVI